MKEISSESQNSTSATSDKSCLQQRNASEQEALLLKPQPHQLRTDLRAAAPTPALPAIARPKASETKGVQVPREI